MGFLWNSCFLALHGICLTYQAFLVPASYDMHAAFTTVPQLFMLACIPSAWSACYIYSNTTHLHNLHAAFTALQYLCIICMIPLLPLHCMYAIFTALPLHDLHDTYAIALHCMHAFFYNITIPLHDRHDTSATSALYVQYVYCFYSIASAWSACSLYLGMAVSRDCFRCK